VIAPDKITESIELCDVLGKKVFADTPKVKSVKINTDLCQSVYFYRTATQDNSMGSGKILVQ
jgi:hypothetical protein